MKTKTIVKPRLKDFASQKEYHKAYSKWRYANGRRYYKPSGPRKTIQPIEGAEPKPSSYNYSGPNKLRDYQRDLQRWRRLYLPGIRERRNEQTRARYHYRKERGIVIPSRAEYAAQVAVRKAERASRKKVRQMTATEYKEHYIAKHGLEKYNAMRAKRVYKYSQKVQECHAKYYAKKKEEDFKLLCGVLDQMGLSVNRGSAGGSDFNIGFHITTSSNSRFSRNGDFKGCLSSKDSAQALEATKWLEAHGYNAKGDPIELSGK